MPPFAQHATIGCDDNSSLFVKQHENGKAGKSITASGVWDEVTYSSEGPSFFDRFFDLNLCCSFDDQVGNNNNNNKQVEEGNTESVVVEQNFTTDMQRYQSRVNREQKIEILKAIQRMKSPMKEAEEAVNHRRREREAAAEQYVYMKPSDDDTTLPTKNNDSWQVFDTPFSNQHDGNHRKNEDTRAQILKKNSRVNSTERRSVTKERDIKRTKGPNQFKKVQSNRTPNNVSSNQNEKETSMMKRIKKSLSTKKVNSNSGIHDNGFSSSTRTTKRTNRSLSLKKFKSIHHKGEPPSPPSSNKKRKSRMAERKNQIETETRQDVEGTVSSLPKKRFSFTKRLSKSFSTKNKNKEGTGNNSVEEVIVDWSQKL